MYTIYHHTNTEKNSAWRSAYEIRMAALEHEKRRFHMLQEAAGLAKPQATHIQKDREAGWISVFKTPLRLFANLMG
jgi:hypothetical protein